MPIPYTREAIAQLRTEARRGTPAELVQQHYGWDARLFATICQRHQIEFATGAAAAFTEAPPRRVPKRVRRTVAKLTPRQAQILGVLRTQVDAAGQWSDCISAAYIARIIGAPHPHSIYKSVVGLSRRLAKMKAGYKIEAKLARGGGYRLVIDKDAR